MNDTQEKRVAELREILAVDPGSPEYVELAKILVEDEETRAECREVCFRGLSRDSEHPLARLVLARSFYLDGFIEFAVRELVELNKQVQVSSLERLLDSFGAHAEPFRQAGSPTTESEEAEEEEEEILAEIDLDDEFVESALDEIETELEVEFDVEMDDEDEEEDD